MMNAYDKVYLEKARTALGRMLDFAVHDLGYSLETFYGLFLASGIADRFGRGDFTVMFWSNPASAESVSNQTIRLTAALNTGPAGPWPIINGRQDFPLRRSMPIFPFGKCPHCIIPSMSWISASSVIG